MFVLPLKSFSVPLESFVGSYKRINLSFSAEAGVEENQVSNNCLYDFSNNFPILVPNVSDFQKFCYSGVP